MGLRDTLNTNRSFGLVAGIVLVVVAVGAIAYQISSSGPAAPAGGDAFYTVDDGKTYFPSSTKELPPFQHEGKSAVRAYVYECNDKPFVAYLEQYTPEAKKVIEEVNRPRQGGTPGPPPNLGNAIGAQQSGRQIKKPGDKDWIAALSPQGNALTREIKCPDGKTATAVRP